MEELCRILPLQGSGETKLETARRNFWPDRGGQKGVTLSQEGDNPSTESLNQALVISTILRPQTVGAIMHTVELKIGLATSGSKRAANQTIGAFFDPAGRHA